MRGGLSVSTTAETLVRQLVNHFASAPKAASPSQSASAWEVLLDVEMEGVRCILVRLGPRPPQAPLILSPREREIVRMVAEGYANKTIAAVLEISSWTVSTYLRRLFAKLSVGSRAAMVARLLEEGMIGKHLPPAKLSNRRRR